MPDNLYVALIHYPVVNKRDKTIGSAATNSSTALSLAAP